MDYNETLKYINDTPKFSKILGNDDLKKLLESFGNPQNTLKFIHIAGTNGKGSVCAMVSAILQKAGYKTGLYTSPYIEVFNERIQINGENISDNDLAEIATLVKDRINEMNIEISVFAQITAMAFIYFSRNKCDYVVLETGLGGRLDATNVIETPAICAITKISLDHTEFLGNSIAKIAAEKCGIIKNNIPVVTCGNQENEALCVIKRYCKENSSNLYISPSEYNYELSLKGEYQKYNAAVASEIAHLLHISEEDIKYGLSHTHWIARFEFLQDNLLLDGGHNPDGIKALLTSLKALNRPVHFVVAMMEDKDFSESAELLNAFSGKVTVTQIDMPRCIKAANLAILFPGCITQENCIAAVENALKSCTENEIVCVCGSLYLAGEIRSHFKNHNC